ncbi:MAG: transposase [Rickettsiaceae bacterium]
MRYPNDLNERQWDLIKHHFYTGKYDRRSLVNTILYIIKTGCQWKFLPLEYPPWKAVYSFYKRDKDKDMWERE